MDSGRCSATAGKQHCTMSCCEIILTDLDQQLLHELLSVSGAQSQVESLAAVGDASR